MYRILIFVICFLLAAAGANAQTQSRPLTNEDIVKMVQAGLGDDIIIATIRQSDSAEFDVSPTGLIRLRGAGVSDIIIRSMMDRTAGKGNVPEAGVQQRPAPRQATSPEPRSAQRITPAPGTQQTQFIRREPVVALLLSGLWPGIGQFYNGPSEKEKGMIMAGAAAGCLVVAVASISSCDYNYYYGYSDCSGSAAGMMLGMLGYAGTAIYSMYDAATRAGELNRQHGFAINIQPEILGGRTGVRASVQYSFSF